jgi:hypothetical protein
VRRELLANLNGQNRFDKIISIALRRCAALFEMR